MNAIVPFLILLFAYTALSGNAQWSNLLVGVAIAAGILALLRPQRQSVRWRRLPGAMTALAAYVWLVIRNMVLSGIQTARIVLDPKLPLNPGIVAIPSECDSDLGQALSAHAISLPPGELIIEAGPDGMMYIHSLDVDVTATQAAKAQRIQRRLIKQIFD
jgi:multicomponent Na+:H+ antiporter subunit E